MTENTTLSQLSKPAVHARLSIILAVFKANKLVELLAILNMVLVLAAIVFAQNFLTKGTALLGFIAGLVVFYSSLRIRIDQSLFEQWDSLDLQALDAALKQVNARFKEGKTFDQRLAGAYQLFKMGLYGLILQFIVLLILAWLFVLKV
jgi:hypothetical protein